MLRLRKVLQRLASVTRASLKGGSIAFESFIAGLVARHSLGPLPVAAGARGWRPTILTPRSLAQSPVETASQGDRPEPPQRSAGEGATPREPKKPVGRRSRIWLIGAMGAAFLLAFPATMLDGVAGFSGPLAPSYMAAVAGSMVALMCYWRVRVRSHFDDHEFCRCYSATVRVIRRLVELDGSQEILAESAREVARVLKLSSASFELRGLDGEAGLAATWGKPGRNQVRMELIHREEPVGLIVVSRSRLRGREFAADEYVLLEELAKELATAAHVLRMNRSLRRSREELIEAREQERHRIRRDLHDGLGPVLATVTMRVEAAMVLLGTDAEAVGALLECLHEETQLAVSDVRRLVAELRPPVLDGLGLVYALREVASRFEIASAGRLTVRVDAVPGLPQLPPEVSLAAYRIASEAITNVARHARARLCVVRLSAADQFWMEISDDGVGIPEGGTPGMGLFSMQERARALGGVCRFEDRHPRGTRVVCHIPLPSEVVS